MIVIDAFNVNIGGGLVLLEYFIKELDDNSIDYLLLLDDRTKDTSFVRYGKVVSIKSSFLKREFFFNRILRNNNVETVFCFGNFPPLLSLKCRVVTYIHNPHLVDRNAKFKNKVKQIFFKLTLNNSNFNIFQTKYISNAFIDKYRLNKESIRILPFFDKNKILMYKNNIKSEASFIYNSFPHLHKNFENLFLAWSILADKGLFPKLYITIPSISNYISQIPKLPNIINLGQLSHENLLKKVSRVKYCIFPSHKETLGLGLVEAGLLNCKVLCNDIENTKEIIKPSLFFDGNEPTDIALSVMKIIEEDLKETKVLLENKIDKLIEFITES